MTWAWIWRTWDGVVHFSNVNNVVVVVGIDPTGEVTETPLDLMLTEKRFCRGNSNRQPSSITYRMHINGPLWACSPTRSFMLSPLNESFVCVLTKNKVSPARKLSETKTRLCVYVHNT